MTVTIINADCREALKGLADASVQTCVTSPPYFGLRDYGHAGQIGLEKSPDDFVTQMVEVFRDVRRVLRDDGTLWLNLGDSYASTGGQTPQRGEAFKDRARGKEHITKSARFTGDGLKPKDLIGIPWRVAFALQADGWYLRQDIIWSKPNPMPESVKDRCTKSHEYVFLLSKSARYFFDASAVAEAPGTDSHGGIVGGGTAYQEVRKDGGVLGVPAADARNRRSVWSLSTQPFKEAHFATFPPSLVELCILAGSPAGTTVLDPFGGAGTTGLVADRLQRHAVLIELNPEYASLARRRISADAPLLAVG